MRHVRRGPDGRFAPHLRLVTPEAPPVAPRGSLSRGLLDVLFKDFAKHGAAVVAELRTAEPAVYLRLVAGLVPKEPDVKRTLDQLSDDDLQTLANLLAAARAEEPVSHGDPPRAGAPEIH